MAHGDKHYTVYILANRKNGTLYVGVTSDLATRVWQHRQKRHPGFTARYDVHKLVWHSTFDSVEAAIDFEKRLKKWRRAWKIALIEERNPDWEDLYPTLGPTNF
ncbi:GIY-YIG nuclease family protein [Aquisalinus flavus]|uniref:Nuclease n=1 Tax=Aquisalinus flavus TaxID=1526572 RepID=A0A8J2Y6J6_9PROT|nr:GIY-YIG nuclease family protein [Aquisalinus flavus]MBD0426101.1 GIY-YIG nuclease family protein [Aquisalinus flavus]MBD0426102.1 GIY-YIG nuclease family protein [Aquisalinus flavus]UNE48313.1 GIY-YIG nuclease family protein [Aquisalinus flavus]UNE48314.1 GIY-YIG nuclease family protein [Aquisalinus flavus]GGD10612.1 nuclease [Aquisalinus flavus]